MSIVSPQIAPSEPLAKPGLHGERVMLIKNGRGDWGIVAGRWTDFKGESSKYPHPLKNEINKQMK